MTTYQLVADALREAEGDAQAMEVVARKLFSIVKSRRDPERMVPLFFTETEPDPVPGPGPYEDGMDHVFRMLAGG